MISSKIAVVQFDRSVGLDLPNVVTANGIDWYMFDEDDDKEFEIEALKPHYDEIYETRRVK